MTIEFVRLADRAALAQGAPALDASPLLGVWHNTSEHAQGLARLEVSETPEGLAVEGVGAGPGAPSWSFHRPRAYRGLGPSPAACGLTAERSADHHRVRLQGNLNLGLLVLCAFRSPLDGPGLQYFSREFFAPFPVGPGPALGPGARAGGRGEIFSAVSMPEAIDPAALVGRWRNAERGARGIREIRIGARAGGDLEARVLGAGPAAPIDWGGERLVPFACVDEAGGRSLGGLAAYDFGFMESHLQVRVPAGTLAVASFNIFKDGSGRADYTTREFFYR